MSNNPYKDYYEAVNRGDEWSGVDADNARKRIQDIKDVASWNGVSEDTAMGWMSNDEMGS